MSTEVNCRMLVVSLPEATTRREQVTECLEGLDIPWKFMDAGRHDAPSEYEYDVEQCRKRFGRLLSLAEIGCFKSHMNALAEFDRDPDLQFLVVLEDDVWFDTAFSMKGLIKWIDERDIGFLRLYARSWKKADFAGWYGERHIIRMKTDPYGAQCYIISRQAATRFRNSVKDIVCPFDDEMAHFWENGLELYTLFPFPICERAIPSSINSQRNSQDQKVSQTLQEKIFFFKYRARNFIRKRLYLYRHPVRQLDTREESIARSLSEAEEAHR